MDLAAYRSIRASRRGRVLTLTLDRPDKLNAVDRTLHAELATVFTSADADPHSDVVVLTGAGRAFCAGGDIEWMQEMIESGFDETAREARQIIHSLLDCEKPVLARLNGHAIGLGATLALFCDLVFAADHARIGDPHVCVGLTAGDGGAIIWPHLVGHARAKEFLLTGDPVTAPEAARIGLINRALPAAELDAAVEAFADRLAAGAQAALRTTKRAINLELKRAAASALEASLAFEAQTNASRDHHEAVAAFAERRKPVFGGGG